MVDWGAVGVIAASRRRAGPRLTLRTFHIGIRRVANSRVTAKTTELSDRNLRSVVGRKAGRCAQPRHGVLVQDAQGRTRSLQCPVRVVMHVLRSAVERPDSVRMGSIHLVFSEPAVSCVLRISSKARPCAKIEKRPDSQRVIVEPRGAACIALPKIKILQQPKPRSMRFRFDGCAPGGPRRRQCPRRLGPRSRAKCQDPRHHRHLRACEFWARVRTAVVTGSMAPWVAKSSAASSNPGSRRARKCTVLITATMHVHSNSVKAGDRLCGRLIP
jgi:hypothetical protein